MACNSRRAGLHPGRPVLHPQHRLSVLGVRQSHVVQGIDISSTSSFSSSGKINTEKSTGLLLCALPAPRIPHCKCIFPASTCSHREARRSKPCQQSRHAQGRFRASVSAPAISHLQPESQARHLMSCIGARLSQRPTLRRKGARSSGPRGYLFGLFLPRIPWCEV